MTTVVFYGMEVESISIAKMFGVYKNGQLLAAFLDYFKATEYLNENSNMGMVEKHGDKLRIIPLNATLEIQCIHNIRKPIEVPYVYE